MTKFRFSFQAIFFLTLLFCLFCPTVLAQKKPTISKKAKAVSQSTKDKRLFAAIQTVDIAKVKLWLKQGANPNQTEGDLNVPFLHTAVEKDSFEIVKLLIEKGADVNQESDFRNISLHLACFNKNLELAKFLIEKGANVNHKGIRGETPIFDAIANGNNEIKPSIKLLETMLNAGADINAQTNNGRTILMSLSIMSLNGDRIEVVKFCLKSGANPNLVDGFGEDALEHARIRKDKAIYDLLKPITTPIEEKRAKLDGKFFKSDDVEIYYKVIGAKTGTPLFVLHGGPGFDHQYFLTNSVFGEFGKSRPIVFFDQRGSGNSPRLMEKQWATLKDVTEDIERLRLHLGFEKIDIFGHSWGGFLAMAYSVAYPQNMSRMIVCDSMHPVYGESVDLFEQKYPEINARRKEARNLALGDDVEALRETLKLYMQMLFYSDKKRDEFISKSDNFRANLYVGMDLQGSAEGTNLTESLKKTNFPTLILHGRHDDNITLDTPKDIQKTIPKSEFIIFEESGHLPFVEEPEKFIQVVNKFLN